MKLYIQQRVFTFGDKFSIYDQNENESFYVEGEVFTFGKKLHLYSANGREAAFIHQKLFSFLPKYYISVNGTDVAEVVKEFTFFRNEYTVNGLGWKVSGDFMDHDYSITSEDRTIAVVSKQWFSWGDAYEIDIAEGIDPALAISVVLIIDACLDALDN